MTTVNHPTDRLNFTKVRTVRATLYFSYETLVAFHTPESGLIVRENHWGTTTGKHLNYIDGGNKKNRVSASKFTELAQRYEVD